MEHRPLGGAGIDVSRLVLGCGNFGGIGSSPAWFGRGTQRAEAFRLLDAAWDAGITTLDTADAYGGGRSESYVGEWLAGKPAGVRDRVVVATKTFNPMYEGADRGLGRSRILRQVEGSLRRLGVERIGLYLAHEFDRETTQEETLAAFGELTRAGKVGAVGASNFTTEELAGALAVSEREGLPRYEWVQNSFSLLEQGDRDGILGLCLEHGLGYTPFSPLAGGWLTGKYRRGQELPAGSRMTMRPEPYERYDAVAVYEALEHLEQLAADRGASMASLALAWVLAIPGVTAVVIGPSRIEQLEPALEAMELELSRDDHDAVADLFARCTDALPQPWERT